MDHYHPGVPNGFALLLIAVYAMGHQGPFLEQAEFIVGLPILLAIRVELPNPGDFIQIFGKMGLDGYLGELLGQFA